MSTVTHNGITYDLADGTQMAAYVQAINQTQQPPPPAPVTNYVTMTPAQLQALIKGAQPTQPAFDQGVNAVMTARNRGIDVLNEDHPPIPGVKDNKKAQYPQAYKGTPEDARPFLTRLHAFFVEQPNAYRLTQTRLRCAVQLMTTGPIASWAHMVLRALVTQEDNSYYTDNWVEFCQIFLEHYGIPNEAEDARNKIHRLVQGNATLEEYITEFSRLQDLAKFNDDSVVQYFKAGLRKELYHAVYQAIPAPTTLHDWKLHARQRELQWREKVAFSKTHHTQGASFKNSTFTPRSSNVQAPFRQNIHHDPNAMQIDAMNTKGQTQRVQPIPVRTVPTPSYSQNTRSNPPRTSRPNQKSGTPPTRPVATCHRCGKPGHFIRDCTKPLDQHRVNQLVQYAIGIMTENESQDPDEPQTLAVLEERLEDGSTQEYDLLSNDHDAENYITSITSPADEDFPPEMPY